MPRGSSKQKYWGAMHPPPNVVVVVIVVIFYPRVYNDRGLKTERIQTAEMTRGPECHQ